MGGVDVVGYGVPVVALQEQVSHREAIRGVGRVLEITLDLDQLRSAADGIFRNTGVSKRRFRSHPIGDAVGV